jgi:hypothetical protein
MNNFDFTICEIEQLFSSKRASLILKPSRTRKILCHENQVEGNISGGLVTDQRIRQNRFSLREETKLPTFHRTFGFAGLI